MESNRLPRVLKRALLCFALVLGATLTFVICVQFRTVPLSVSEDPTCFVEPLRPDGSLDFARVYEQHFTSPDVSSPDNGFRLIVQRIEQNPDYLEPDEIKRICRKLDIDISTVTTDLPYEEPFVFLEGYASGPNFDEDLIRRIEAENLRLPVGSDQLNGQSYSGYDVFSIVDERASKPWTLDDLPMMRSWLQRNQLALDLVAEAVRQPIFEMPFIACENRSGLEFVYASSLTIGTTMRSYARGYNCRINYRIGIGDIDGAIDDIVTCLRLGRYVQGHKGTIQQLIGLAI